MNDALSAAAIRSLPVQARAGSAAPAGATSRPVYQAGPIRLPDAARARAHDREVSIGFVLANPNIALLDGLISADESAQLIRLATGKLRRSEVVDRSGGGTRVSSVRTSEGTWFEIAENEIVDRLERRIAALTGVPVDNGEPLQILHYLPGGEYQAHHDYFDPADPGSATYLEVGGQRIATLIVYLADVEAGGETAFPTLGLSIRPRMGTGVYFEYCDRHGLLDVRCLHAGAPVVRGEKWIATKWLRESAYRAPAR